MKHLIIAVLMFAATARAAEETPLPALTVTTGANSNGGDFVVGYLFTLDKPMTVTALGMTDQNKDGKLNEPEPVEVAIWDATGKQIVTG